MKLLRLAYRITRRMIDPAWDAEDALAAFPSVTALAVHQWTGGEKMKGNLISIDTGEVVAPFKFGHGADGWACVVMNGRHRGETRCVRTDVLQRGTVIDMPFGARP